MHHCVPANVLFEKYVTSGFPCDILSSKLFYYFFTDWRSWARNAIFGKFYLLILVNIALSEKFPVKD